MFVKGHLYFSLAGHQLEFIHQNVSHFGITGLPWAPLSPHEHFGKTVNVQVKLQSPEQMQFRTAAYIVRERTTVSDFMGLKFRMDAQLRSEIEAIIKRHGKMPADWKRKYPRIPSAMHLDTFPLRVLGTLSSDAHLSSGGVHTPIVFDVGNIGPQGLQIFTENPLAASFKPGQRLTLLIDPRGKFHTQIRAQASICRIIDEVHGDSGNAVRYLGLSFTKLDSVNKAAFLKLLSTILTKIQGRQRTGS